MASNTALNSNGTNENQDLGFGSVVAERSAHRLLNRDGTFNVQRHGLGSCESVSFYQSLISMSWGQFLLWVVGIYFAINVLFALAYMACGEDSIVGSSDFSHFWKCFFFSIQTFATIGYGQLTPHGMTANFLVAFEALTGLMVFAIATGLLFARFARPSARIIFSKVAVVAPYRGITGLQFRLTNARRSQLLQLEIKVILAIFEGDGAQRKRNFYPLQLERSQVAFFPLSWTVVHPITEKSPIWGFDSERLKKTQAECLVLLSAYDETFAQTVHTRTSYLADDVIWEARFKSMYLQDSPSKTEVSIDVSLLSEVERVQNLR